MAEISKTIDQNLLPVQAYFNVDGTFNTFIGQGQPFYATANPFQSGLHITNSTIDSSVIGGTTPAAGYFSLGTVAAAPVNATDIANKQYVDYFAAGLSWKQPALVASLANIPTLSGLLTIDGITLVDGDRVLVKNQSTASQNGIYIAHSGAWTYAIGADNWAEYVGAIIFITEGTQSGSAWFSTAQPGGTLGTTALNWSNFSVSSTYSAGTGLSLTGFVFSITNTGVTAATKGSASKTVTATVNAQGQLTSLTDQDIAIAASQITSGTISSSLISGAYTGITSVGTLGSLTVTSTISGSINGNAATATTATKATNIANGATGSLPYQSAANTTALLAAGSNGQVLTLAAGVPSWATPTTGTVTSVSGTGAVSGITLTGTVTSSGSLTLGGSLDLSSPPAIGGTTRNTAAFTTELVGPSASANFTRFPNALAVISNTAAGIQQNESHNIGLMAEGVANASNSAIYGVGLYGVGYTNGGTRSGGVIGEGHVSATGDTGSAIGVRGYANDTHAGGLNIGLYGDAANGSASYALYMNNGGIYSAGAQTWTLNGNLTLSGAYTVTIPTLSLTNALSTSYGGTGATTANAGLNNLLPSQTSNANKVLTTDGTNTSWATPTAYATVTDDTSTAATRYPLFASVTTGNLTTEYTSSTKLQFNPSTGIFTATGFSYSDTLTGGTGIVNLGSGQFYKDASGNVGIGTSSPAVKLDVNGSMSLGSILTTGNAVSTGDCQVEIGGNRSGSGNSYVDWHAQSGSDADFRIIRGGGANGVVQFLQAGTGVMTFNLNGTSGDAGSASERMRIDSSGNLLVGTTSAAFSNSTSFYVQASSTGLTVTQHPSGTAAGSAYAWFTYNGGAIGSITQVLTTGVAYNVSSDYRLKNNQKPLENSGLFIDALQPKTWDWFDGNGTGAGFIAHEFATTCPNYVVGEKDAVDENGKPHYQSIDASNPEMMANIIAELQSLRKRIAELENK